MPNAIKAMRQVVDTPVPELVERLGLAIAEAQHELDLKALDIARLMSEQTVPLGSPSRLYSMIELGFTPTFYAFSEATIDTKVTFTIREEIEIGVGGSVTGGYPGVFAVTVNADYSRKYGFEVQGSSSIAARIVSLPPPARLQQVLNDIAAANIASTNTP